MGFSHAKIFRLMYFLLLSVFFFGTGDFLHAQNDTGAQASISGFALPQYRKSDNRLQFILYGNKASNLGALVEVENMRLDIINENLRNINSIVSMADVMLYPLYIASDDVRRFWKKRPHSRALLHAPQAVFDKNKRTLRGEGDVYFRSRELDINGVGFDAYYDNRFIHIRSNVRVVIRAEARDKNMASADWRRDRKKEEKNIKSNTGDPKK